jgi:putative transposase
MIDKASKLAISRQTRMLGLSRSSVYYRPAPVAKSDLVPMRRIDELHLEHPFAGARMLRGMLRLEGKKAGRGTSAH